MKFNFFKTEINISFVVIAILSFVILLNFNGNLFWCFIAIVIHETGHLVFMYCFNSPPKAIYIKLFGIRIIDSKRIFQISSHNLLIVFGGIIFNFMASAIGYLFFYFTKSDVFLLLCATNFCTALFNLLPVISLDGGQALYIILNNFFSEKITNAIINIITIILIFPTAILGFLVLFYSKYNFSLLLICIYLIVTLVLGKSKFF